MSAEDHPLDQSDIAPDVHRIDFSRYDVPELREAIGDALDIKWTLLLLSGIFLAAWAAFSFACVATFMQKEGAVFYTAVTVSVIASFILAALLALVLTLHRVLRQVVRLMDVSLETAALVLEDTRQARDKGGEGGSVVFEGVCTHLILPIIEEVIRRQLWLIAWPAVWVTRCVFLLATRIITRLMRKYELPAEARLRMDGEKSQAAAENAETAARYTHGFLEATHGYVGRAARIIGCFVLIPMWCLFGVGVLLLAILAGGAHLFV